MKHKSIHSLVIQLLTITFAIYLGIGLGYLTFVIIKRLLP